MRPCSHSGTLIPSSCDPSRSHVYYDYNISGMITAMDDAVSLIMRAFQKKQYMDNLLVVFTSDVREYYICFTLATT